MKFLYVAVSFLIFAPQAWAAEDNGQIDARWRELSESVSFAAKNTLGPVHISAEVSRTIDSEGGKKAFNDELLKKAGELDEMTAQKKYPPALEQMLAQAPPDKAGEVIEEWRQNQLRIFRETLAFQYQTGSVFKIVESYASDKKLLKINQTKLVEVNNERNEPNAIEKILITEDIFAYYNVGNPGAGAINGGSKERPTVNMDFSAPDLQTAGSPTGLSVLGTPKYLEEVDGEQGKQITAIFANVAPSGGVGTALLITLQPQKGFKITKMINFVANGVATATEFSDYRTVEGAWYPFNQQMVLYEGGITKGVPEALKSRDWPRLAKISPETTESRKTTTTTVKVRTAARMPFVEDSVFDIDLPAGSIITDTRFKNSIRLALNEDTTVMKLANLYHPGAKSPVFRLEGQARQDTAVPATKPYVAQAHEVVAPPTPPTPPAAKTLPVEDKTPESSKGNSSLYYLLGMGAFLIVIFGLVGIRAIRRKSHEAK